MTKRQRQETEKQINKPIDEKRLTWKDVLLGEGPRFEIPIPTRGKVQSRKILRLGGNPHP